MNDEEIRKISDTDQGTAATKDFAKMLGIFFNTLCKECEIDQMIAMNITIVWMQHMIMRMQQS